MRPDAPPASTAAPSSSGASTRSSAPPCPSAPARRGGDAPAITSTISPRTKSALRGGARRAARRARRDKASHAAWSVRAPPRRAPLGPEDLRAILERLAHTMRRLVEHQRARSRAPELMRGARAAPRRAPAGIPRSKSDPSADPRSTSAAITAQGPGSRPHRSPPRRTARTRLEARIADARSARVADQRDRWRRPASSRSSSATRCTFVVFVQRQHGLRDARRRSAARPVRRVSSAAIEAARVERVARARAEIAQIADRRRDDVETTPGRVCHYTACSSVGNGECRVWQRSPDVHAAAASGAAWRRHSRARWLRPPAAWSSPRKPPPDRAHSGHSAWRGRPARRCRPRICGSGRRKIRRSATTTNC